MILEIFLAALLNQQQKPKVVKTLKCEIVKEKSSNGTTFLNCGHDENGDLTAEIPNTEIIFVAGDVFIFNVFDNDEVKIAPKVDQPSGSKYVLSPPCKAEQRSSTQMPCNPNLKSQE